MPKSFKFFNGPANAVGDIAFLPDVHFWDHFELGQCEGGVMSTLSHQPAMNL